jgi:hypothetical protein
VARIAHRWRRATGRPPGARAGALIKDVRVAAAPLDGREDRRSPAIAADPVGRPSGRRSPGFVPTAGRCASRTSVDPSDRQCRSRASARPARVDFAQSAPPVRPTVLPHTPPGIGNRPSYTPVVTGEWPTAPCRIRLPGPAVDRWERVRRAVLVRPGVDVGLAGPESPVPESPTVNTFRAGSAAVCGAGSPARRTAHSARHTQSLR